MSTAQVVSVRTIVDDYGWLEMVETIRLTCASCLEVVERPIHIRWWTNPPMPRYCSQVCAKREEARRRRRAGHGFTIRLSKRRTVYGQDGWKCRSCGSTENLTIDHIIARAKGGSNKLHNLQTLCSDCNQTKADS